MNVRGQDGLTRDLEGGEVLDFESAREDALFSSKQILAEVLRAGGPLDDAMGNSIEITDSKGGVVAMVSFADGAAANPRGLTR